MTDETTSDQVIHMDAASTATARYRWFPIVLFAWVGFGGAAWWGLSDGEWAFWLGFLGIFSFALREMRRKAEQSKRSGGVRFVLVRGARIQARAR
jgi:hypothetical protein